MTMALPLTALGCAQPNAASEARQGAKFVSCALQEEHRVGANGPSAWRRTKTDLLARRSGAASAENLGPLVPGGKWGPLGAGAAAAAPMVKRPLEELVTALRKARRVSCRAKHPSTAFDPLLTARSVATVANARAIFWPGTAINVILHSLERNSARP